MNSQELLACESDFCCGVLGRGDEFLLVDVASPLDDVTAKIASEKGFFYCGCLGVVRGEMGAMCASCLDVDCMRIMLRASARFAVLVWEWQGPQSKGDDVVWLDALFRLSDKRG
jgi:hypothetical protein